MATLQELVQRRDLRPVKVNLARNMFEERKFYATPDFWQWLNGPLRQAPASHKPDLRPAEQVLDLLRQFITGAPFPNSRWFKLMRPVSDDVWEFSKPDVRIFGWFPAKDNFVAVRGDFLENLKTNPALYSEHRNACVDHRKSIDLDEPKYRSGATYNDVIST